jgi:DNA-binding transcriptional MocR family regulator
MLIPIERGSREPVARQIVGFLRRAIEAGRLSPGAKLEPIRLLAKRLGVNRETVAAAYRELEVLGLTESTVGRGTFVRAAPGAAPGNGAAPASSEPPRRVELVVSRAVQAAAGAMLARIDYSAPEGAVHFERLVPDVSLYPHEDFRRALNRALVRAGPALYDYGDPRGLEGLRRALVERMTRLGIEREPDEVVVTAGATQGFAIAARVFCDPGDAVVVESPTYTWACAALVSLGVRPVPVPLGPDGIELAQLDAALARGDVRFVYTMPSFQNPTGLSTSLAHRRALLELTARHGVPVLEDDFEYDLRVRGRAVPPLAALDRRGGVVYMGTCSKTLFPAARVGWLCAPRGFVEGALFAKRTMDLTTSPLIQAGLEQFLSEGSYDRHQRRVVGELEARLDAARRALDDHLPRGARVAPVDGGYLLWVTLPGDVDTLALLPEAKRAGVVYSPGQLYYPDGRASASLRLSVAHTPVAAIERGAKILGEVAKSAVRRSRRAGRAAEAIHV